MKPDKMKWQIICKTDPYHAARYPGFSRGSVRIYEQNLDYADACRILLDMFNRDFEVSAPNWGLAVHMFRNRAIEGAEETYSDGSRSYTYDVFRYSIEPMDTEE